MRRQVNVMCGCMDVRGISYEATLTQEVNSWTVHLAGEIDYAASLELKDLFDCIVQSCDNDLNFDLERVSLIDSEGIKMLIFAIVEMQRKRKQARVMSASPFARRILDMVGVDALMT